MSNRAISILVPGTSANCGSGFDTLGVACTIYNEMRISLEKEEGLELEVEGEGAGNIPNTGNNIVWRAIQSVLNKVGTKNYKGAKIFMKNNIPLSRGLGSSAAAIVAGIKAANVLLEAHLSQRDLLKLATDIEGHPDNVAPAIYGGFTVSLVKNGMPECFSFVPKMPLKLVVAIPDFPLSTKTARSVLPNEVPMKDAIFNVSRAAMMVAALMRGNAKFLRSALDDALHQPYRAKLIPGMYDVFDAAKKEGAIGGSLSGAGPCLVAYTLSNPVGVGEAMVAEFKKNNIDARAIVLRVDERGVRVLR